MRAVRPIGLAVVVFLTFVFVFGCTSYVPPTVTRALATPMKANPRFFILARFQNWRIAESLRNAGLTAAHSVANADYTLDVRVGQNRRSTSCGSIHNVAYLLRSEGRFVMVIKGRGLTGHCSPNIFDAMSQKLASFVGS